jgi:glycerol uptake facilitator-like aquaporin
MVHGPNATAAVFATYPSEHLSVLGSVFDQVSATALLCFCIGIVVDERNAVPKWAQPPLLGLALATICMGLLTNAGCAMNPARDFGPRLFTAVAGWGWEVFSYRDYSWFWVPTLCPFVGAVIGAWLYHATLGAQLRSALEHDDSHNHSINNGTVTARVPNTHNAAL